MLLVDTSVWVDHLNHGDRLLIEALQDRRVLGHPFVIGEIAVGHLRERTMLLDHLRNLPAAAVASDEEVHTLIDRRQLFGRGIGYVDAHLLAATMLTAGAQLWTRDKRLLSAASELNMAATVE
jgi:predicted nucleic acid-binding protein